MNLTISIFLGYDLNEILGRNCRFLQGTETDKYHVYRVRKSIKEGADCHVCLLNYRKDGTPFYNRLFMTALRDTTGRIKSYLGVQTEVSNKIAAELTAAEVGLSLQRVANARLEHNAPEDGSIISGTRSPVLSATGQSSTMETLTSNITVPSNGAATTVDDSSPFDLENSMAAMLPVLRKGSEDTDSTLLVGNHDGDIKTEKSTNMSGFMIEPSSLRETRADDEEINVAFKKRGKESYAYKGDFREYAHQDDRRSVTPRATISTGRNLKRFHSFDRDGNLVEMRGQTDPNGHRYERPSFVETTSGHRTYDLDMAQGSVVYKREDFEGTKLEGYSTPHHRSFSSHTVPWKKQVFTLDGRCLTVLEPKKADTTQSERLTVIPAVEVNKVFRGRANRSKVHSHRTTSPDDFLRGTRIAGGR